MLGTIEVEFGATAHRGVMNKRISFVIKIAFFIWLILEGRSLDFQSMYFLALAWVLADVVGTGISAFRTRND